MHLEIFLKKTVSSREFEKGNSKWFNCDLWRIVISFKLVWVPLLGVVYYGKIKLSCNVFVFVDFNVHHMDWLTYSGGTNRLGELCYNFSSQMTLLRCLTFLLGSLTVTLTVLLFWINFFLLMLVFVLQWLSLHWEILVILLSQFPLTFQ